MFNQSIAFARGTAKLSSRADTAGAPLSGWGRALVAGGFILFCFTPWRGSLAQDGVPIDIVQSIVQLAQKLNALKDDRPKLDAALKRLDGEIDVLRSKDENARAAALLVRSLNDLNDTKREAVRQDATFKELFAIIDRIQDGTDFARATRLSDQLVVTLQNARLKKDEEGKLQDKLSVLAAALEPRLKDRPLKIHIISARYGIQGTSRTCDAKAYFRAKCEGQIKCPVPTGSPPDSLPLTITGSELCGFDPAPLADAGASTARVEYACMRFGLTPWAEIERTVKKGTSIDFAGKGQITCDFQ